MKRRKLFLLGVLVLIPTGAGFGLAEAYVRLFDEDGYYTPATLRDGASLHYQPAVYARHIFPARALTVPGWSGNVYRINAKGYRGPDFATSKPEGTRRIIIYGGSAVFNLGATEGKDWPRRVEALLRRWGLGNIEVINAGIPGHAATDAVGRLLTEGHFFAPDYVVLYTGWNDIKNFHLAEPILRQIRPWRQGLDPRLYYQGALDEALSGTSQLYVRLRQGYWRWRLGAGAEGATKARDPSPVSGRIVERESPNAYGFYDRGPAQFKLSVSAFVDIARAIGAVPVLAKQARLGGPDNTKKHKQRIRYGFINLDHRGYLEAYARMDRALEEVAEEKAVLLIDTASHVPRDLNHFVDHVHLRDRGARAVARVVAEHLRALIEADRARGGGSDSGASGSAIKSLAARAEYRLDRPNRALRALRRAADLDLTNMGHQYEAALALQRAGQHEESRAYLERLVAADPGYRDTLFLLGFAHQKAGRRTEAIEAYRRFLRVRPNHEHTHFNLGYALRYAGGCAEAVGHFQRVLALQPNRRAAHLHLSACFRTLGEETRAAEHAARYRDRGR